MQVAAVLRDLPDKTRISAKACECSTNALTVLNPAPPAPGGDRGRQLSTFDLVRPRLAAIVTSRCSAGMLLCRRPSLLPSSSIQRRTCAVDALCLGCKSGPPSWSTTSQLADVDYSELPWTTGLSVERAPSTETAGWASYRVRVSHTSCRQARSEVECV